MAVTPPPASGRMPVSGQAGGEVKPPVFIFYYSKNNRASFNALAGALESSGPPGLELLFPETETDLLETVRTALDRGRRPAAGLSFFTSQASGARNLISRLRGRFGNDVAILAGGPHPSGAPEEVLAMGADCVVRGEGEKTIIRLAKLFLEGGRAAGTINSCPGTAALDDFPPFSPKWHLFGPIEITRGCPFGCAYCQTTYLAGARPRHRSLENLLALTELMNSEKLKSVRFISPDAFAYGSPDGRRLVPEQVEKLLKGVRGILGREGQIFFGSFPSEVRPDHVTPELLELTRRYATNKRLVIGAQSGSGRMLEAVRRGHTVDDIYRAVKLAAAAGFGTDVDFIFGLPGETAKDEEATISVMKDLTDLGARIHAHTFMPLPQTPLARARPSPISPKAEKFLKNLCSGGKAFGQWEAQRTIGQKALRNMP